MQNFAVLVVDHAAIVTEVKLVDFDIPTLANGEHAEGILRGPLAIDLDQPGINELSAHKNALTRGTPATDQEQRQLDLSLGLIRAIRRGRANTLRPRIATRHRAFSRARSYIDAYAGEELTSADLSTAAGVSQRTLEYAFKDCSGLSPKAYLKVVRLNRSRVSLRRADPYTHVVDAANQWGFWHMGQFARDYQALFGVRPKDDLHARRT